MRKGGEERGREGEWEWVGEGVRRSVGGREEEYEWEGGNHT